jgi:hypothetical protein
LLNIFPVEFENYLKAHPKIQMSVVIEVLSRGLGSSVANPVLFAWWSL